MTYAYLLGLYCGEHVLIPFLKIIHYGMIMLLFY